MQALRTSLRTWSRRVLILTHRYLGIAISLLLVMWFASGIVMMYVGDMPRIDARQRLAALPELDVRAVRIGPSEAQVLAGLPTGAVPVLLSVLDRPAYRFAQDGTVTVFADDGSVLQPLDEEQGAAVARRFAEAGQQRVHFDAVVEQPDQWTLSLRGQLPLYRYRIDDGRGTLVYVSPVTAEVALQTTRRSRALAWVGTIPHWLYFSSLRTNQALWSGAIIWSAAAACVLAALGLVLAFTQWRRVRPLRLKTAIPYRGLMRWHYISGALFGTFALTWAFSGLMSVEPWNWTQIRGLAVDRAALSGGPVDVAAYPPLPGTALAAAAAPAQVKEVRFERIQDELYYVLVTTQGAAPREALEVPPSRRRHTPDGERVLVHAASMTVRDAPFATEAILHRLQQGAAASIVEHSLLEEYDDYYYSRRGERVLPVLRVKFDDELGSWVYVDPRNSSVVAQVHRYSRVERWLYHGLHSLDFRFWYSRRPLWDIGMLVLLLGGLVCSAAGLYLGVRRMVRAVRL